MQTNGIKHIIAPVTPNKDKNNKRKRTEHRQIANVLNHMMSAANYPLLIHCNAGKVRPRSTLEIAR